jgi:hypothetical protein
MNKPLYMTAEGLAKRAGVARTVVLRQVAQNILIPDGELVFGGSVQPLFSAQAAVNVLQQFQREKSRRGMPSPVRALSPGASPAVQMSQAIA